MPQVRAALRDHAPALDGGQASCPLHAQIAVLRPVRRGDLRIGRACHKYLAGAEETAGLLLVSHQTAYGRIWSSLRNARSMPSAGAKRPIHVPGRDTIGEQRDLEIGPRSAHQPTLAGIFRDVPEVRPAWRGRELVPIPGEHKAVGDDCRPRNPRPPSADSVLCRRSPTNLASRSSPRRTPSGVRRRPTAPNPTRPRGPCAHAVPRDRRRAPPPARRCP